MHWVAVVILYRYVDVEVAFIGMIGEITVASDAVR